MSVVGGTVRRLGRAAGRAATMTTEAAGALGGAAVNGVVGGVTGAAEGAQRGLRKGSHSTPAAALTIGALGVTGLVEWPVLLAVGGTVLVMQQLNRRGAANGVPAKPPRTAASTPIASARSVTPRSPAQPKSTSARQPRTSPSRGRH